MSLEQQITQLDGNIAAMNKTIQTLIDQLMNMSIAPTDKVVGTSVATEEGPTHAVAGKKTYIWMKNVNKGLIVQKGELLPLPKDDTVAVGKTKWEELCKQYNLDPETGDTAKIQQKVEQVDDDLGDLEDPAPVASDDDDFDLDEEEEKVDETQALKDKLIEVVKKTGQNELVRKILAKLEVQNADQLKVEHIEKGLKLCAIAIEKYSK